MKSVCFFSSYFTGNKIPYYVKKYVEELAKHFTQVVILCNPKALEAQETQYLAEKNIQLKMYENEGMDFGMWYKAFAEYNLEMYDRIGLVNDSCILYNSLDKYFGWFNNSIYDYAGMVITGKVQLHVQSYFLTINKRAIPAAKAYFEEMGIKKTYKGIITNYEIGLSQYLIEKGLNIAGMYNYYDRKDVNPAFILAPELIANGCPLIKKKIINHQYYRGDYLTWFRNNFIIDHRYYIDLIKKNNPANNFIDWDKVVAEVQADRSLEYIANYNRRLKLYKRLRKVALLRFVFHQLIFMRRRLRTEEK